MENQQTGQLDGSSEAETPVQYLTFFVGDETFAMEISVVREIIQYNALTPVPLMPECVRGVINLRGAVVPVIDLKARFGWSKSTIGKKTCIIIFDSIGEQSERIELGLMVDAVSEVLDLAPSQVETAPQFGGAIRRDFMRGVGKVNGRFVVLLDPAQALNIEDMTHAAA
jgi:purine-binding chemotaxis protein CheW